MRGGRRGGSVVQPLHRNNLITPTRCDPMMAASSRDWNVFKQIFADHWEPFQQAYPRYQTAYYESLVAKMLACGNPEKIGYSEYRCLHCGQGKHLVAMSCKSSLCLRCAKVSVDNWVSQVSRVLHEGVIYRHIILSWITTAAMTDTPRQKSPTHGNPPNASISPPSDAPPNTPSWLLTVNDPVAVVRESPASSSNNVGVTADDILASAAVPHASATVTHGDTWAVKTRAARRPLPQHDRANKATRRCWSATRPPRTLPTMAPVPAR